MRSVCLLAFCALPAIAMAQQPAPAPPAAQFEDRVEVVAVTPIPGIGLSKLKIPANVQVFTAGAITSATLDLPSLLADRAASVHVADAQAGSFQPDVVFRGFTGSPLLGASEGVAVYQDGVRVNEAFGDTVNWDLLPQAAIARISLSPGSNPLFGLNALGGALSIATKDGFNFPGRRGSVTTGSFGRHQLQAEFGGHRTSLGYFVAAGLTGEAGWRDFSPSTVRQIFGDVSWRGVETTANVSVTAASNDLTGNGAAPIGLLEADRRAVFTHPDRSDNDLALVTARAQRRTAATLLAAVAYYRHSDISTFNGDAADDDDDDDDDEGFDAINNHSRTRGRAAGATAQMTRTAPLRARDNHFVAGAGVDSAVSAFNFVSEWAQLTPDRGTAGSDLLDDESFVDLHTRTTTASAFVTDAWSLTPRLTATGSARFNWTAVTLRDRIGTALNGDHRFGRINPAGGVTFQARPDLNVYASYAQASRVPTPVELTCADPEDPCRLPNAFVSDPPLEQIVAVTWEAGARGMRGRASWGVSAFSTAAADDIIFVSSGTLRGEGHFENVASTRRAGVEASAEYAAADRWSAFGTYTFQRATFGADLTIASRLHPLAGGTDIRVAAGDRLPGVPAHTGKFGVDAALGARLRVGVSVKAQSGQYLRGDEANLLPKLGGFAVVNAQARQRITSRVAVVGHAHNLLDTDYATFGILGDAELLGEDFEDEPRFSSPGAPRAAWVGVEVRF